MGETEDTPERSPDGTLERWLRVLRSFCPPLLYESIEGDLLEQYDEDVTTLGRKIAMRRFKLNVLRFFRPGIILRNRFSHPLINTIMLRSYLTVAFRNIFKNKVFSAINIVGLGIGLAACLLILQFVTFEWSYDNFNTKQDRTYRVTNDRFQNGKLIQHGTIMYPTIGPAMAKDYPEIEEYTRMMPGGTMNIKIDDKIFAGDVCIFSDEYFFSVFSYPLLAGERSTALKDRYSLVLTEKIARKYFDIKPDHETDVIGKVVYWGLDPQPYKITGVLKDLPENSHLQFDVLVSYNTLISVENHEADDSWGWSDMRHYLVLKPGVDYKSLESKFPTFSDRHFQGDKVSGSVEKFYLQPLRDAHLYSSYEYDIAKTASGKAVWAMLIVALFILVIAWINYINLTTSRALDRAKEVGLRKVMGALKSQLMKQFIFESILISLLALLVAFVIVQIAQKPFNGIIGNNLSLGSTLLGLPIRQLVMMAGVMLGGILLSGFYPAFVLSSYQPVTVLKGKFQRSSKGQFLRKSLVVFQFIASAALITSTIIVSKQLRFMNEADLGININNTVIVDSPDRTRFDSTFIQRVENYKHALNQINGVINATTSNSTPGDRLGRAFNIRLSDQPSTVKYTMSTMGVDYNFFDTYSVPLLAGRKFLPTDHKLDYKDLNTIILNEKAIQLLGIKAPEDANGKVIAWGNNQVKEWTIVGVVGDYHQESLKNPMEAMVFRPFYSTNYPTSIRLRHNDRKRVMADIEKVYKEFFPDNAFVYSFLEDNYRRQYNDDNRFGSVVSIFTVLAIIISCLGLIGLSSYTAVQRTKEIGIRKVLGASLFNIVSILSVDFIGLVLVATLLALPIAYYAMHSWLQGYAYKISLTVALFVVPVLLIIAIAAITISFQIIKTAMSNPADTLKYE